MAKILVWTKQNAKVLEGLESSGRHIAKREFICADMQEHADIMLNLYYWLANHAPNQDSRPYDVKYPVWVSLKREEVMLLHPGFVILELEIDESMLIKVNINKWSSITNYSYIPINEKDSERHKELLKQYGVSDAKAYMTNFYPQVKREIVKSWDRLFDDDVILGNDLCYGIIWEIRAEWIKKVIK